jgi:phosphoribosylformylglycinamidine synthase subunit PurQ / glutaminase
MRFGVVVFPGSNRDHDAWHAISNVFGQSAEFIWHDSKSVGQVDALILPGGFAYGDYLRCGAIAKFSPVMGAIKKFAADGGLVLGICNGFQILVESGLLPGALLRNRGLKFVCREVTLRVETTNTPFTCEAVRGQLLKVPVAHGEGSYFADEKTLDMLEREDRVVVRYAENSNPNGSLRDIAGICNERRNVMGLMPHPEDAVESLLGSTDGRVLFESMVHSLVASHAA